LTIYPFPDRLLVGVDSRFDRIYQKVERLLGEEPIRIFKMNEVFSFIMGISWPADEKIIFPALIRLMKRYHQLNVIIVPHEINESHIQTIEHLFRDEEFETERYSSFKKDDGTHARVAIIDTVGILSKLYRVTKLAYVGGGFGSGVHNVMEPAAFAQPVLFGPRHINSYEAVQLEYLLAAHTIRTEVEFEITAEYLITREKLRIEKGRDARKFLTDNLGSTQKTLDILELVDSKLRTAKSSTK
jgi:3-deoxy-D-manno-octulosonic-acid transferase